LLFLFLMGISFLGYVLPWGQISFWGAAVITNFFRVVPLVGEEIVFWVWGGYLVGVPTLKFFFILHFFLPLLLFLIVVWHLILIHIFGSFRGLGFNIRIKLVFFSKFFLKDSLIFSVLESLFFFISYIFIVEEENFLSVDVVSSPLHIKPEWYFLFFYSILRIVPSKVFGVLLLFLTILLLILMSRLFLYFKSSYIGEVCSWILLFFAITLLVIGGVSMTKIMEQFGYLIVFLYFIWSVVYW